MVKKICKCTTLNHLNFCIPKENAQKGYIKQVYCDLMLHTTLAYFSTFLIYYGLYSS